MLNETTRKLYQNVADQEVTFFMADDTDHRTGETGLTPAAFYMKPGETAFTGSAPVTITEIAGGVYRGVVDTGLVDLLGELLLKFTGTGADDAYIVCNVERNPENLFRDARVAGDGARKSLSEKYVGTYKWDGAQTSPISVSVSGSWNNNEGSIELRAYDIFTDETKVLGTWDPTNGWVKDSGWDAAIVEYILQAYVVAPASADYPGGAITLTVLSGLVGDDNRELVLEIPRIKLDETADLVWDRDGRAIPWNAGIIAMSPAGANLLRISGNPVNDNSAELHLRKLSVVCDGDGEDAVRIDNVATSGGGVGLRLRSSQGNALLATVESPATASVVKVVQNGLGAAVDLVGKGDSEADDFAVRISQTDYGDGLRILGGSTAGKGVYIGATDGLGKQIEGGNDHSGLLIQSGPTGSVTQAAISVSGKGNAAGLKCTAQGTGKDITAPDNDLGGGAATWTDPEKEQIRDALGVDGTKTAATGGQLQGKPSLSDIEGSTVLAKESSVGDLPTLAEMEASEFLLKSVAQGENSVAMTPDAVAGFNVLAKARATYSGQVEHIASARQARWFGRDFYDAWNLDSLYSGGDHFSIELKDLNGGPLSIPADATISIFSISAIDGAAKVVFGNIVDGVWTKDANWDTNQGNNLNAYGLLGVDIQKGASDIPEGELFITANCDLNSGPWIASVHIPSTSSVGYTNIQGLIHKDGYIVDRSTRKPFSIAIRGAVGGGGAADWTAAEKEQIRDSLGVDGDKTAAVGGQLQTVKDTGDLTKADTGQILGTGVPVASLSVQATTDVKDAVVEALTVDTYPEQAQTFPPAPWSILTLFRGLFQYFKNPRNITNTQETSFRGNGTDNAGSRTVSDDGSTVRLGKME